MGCTMTDLIRVTASIPCYAQPSTPASDNCPSCGERLYLVHALWVLQDGRVNAMCCLNENCAQDFRSCFVHVEEPTT